MGKRPSEAEIAALQEKIDSQRLTRVVAPVIQEKAVAGKKRSKEVENIDGDPKGLGVIKLHLQMMAINTITEYQFSDGSKCRFDLAIPSEMIAIEYEGLMSAKSRHTTISGYSADCEKYNRAVIDGWKVLRYTAKTYQNFINDFAKIRKHKILET